uniref:Thymus, brain and testes associated n=1 Tax=Electrophorus electricus TaxID=8005 RepID=A0A4W4EXY6_ELEEL
MFWPISAAANHTEVCVSQVMESGGDGQTAPPNASGLEPAAVGNPARVIADFPKVTTRGSARFGTLSLNSFFSRHNPHPHRVTHMSGLNGSPVCMVNDDWYANTPLCPHPLIRSQMPAAGPGRTSLSVPSQISLGSAAWREELKDLAAKVSQPASGPKEEAPRRKTQYSAQTGRLIPASSWGAKRRDTQVLELLCQILQTDSLSLVQKWLLLAGDRGETQKGDDLCTVTLCVCVSSRRLLCLLLGPLLFIPICCSGNLWPLHVWVLMRLPLHRQATEIQESSQPRSRKHTVESSPNTNYFQRPPYQCFWVFLNINLYTQICDV